MNMVCVHCGTESETDARSFGAVCSGCGNFLHACVQCRLWVPSSKACSSPTTDETGDPLHRNCCEEFQPHGARKKEEKPGGEGARERFLKLFGNGGGA